MNDWDIAFHPDFVPEFRGFERSLKREIGKVLDELREKGPKLGRPAVDTLKGSTYANMKEMRIRTADGEWRFAFVFDPSRMGIVLCGGDKSGVGQKTFYGSLIELADKRYGQWLRENQQ